MSAIDVGAAIFHRKRGVGRVVDVETRKWEAEDTRYLVVEMTALSYTIHIPDSSPEIRRVVSDTDIIFNTLRSQAESLPQNYRTRQAQIRDALDSGEPGMIAAAARDLRAYAESEQGNWTTGGERLYQRALRMLAAEVAAAQECSMAEATDRVTNAMGATPRPPRSVD